MTGKPTELPLIDNPDALAAFIGEIRDAQLLAIDTEFVRERTYYPELCVLQIATTDTIAAIDCLAEIDLQDLLTTMHAQDKTWLLHSARQDLEVLANLAGQLPASLIDTQVAAGLIGMPLQIGLQGLLEEILDVRIAKQHTRANWSRRPLTDELTDYALDDVRYLLPLWDSLNEQLSTMDRRHWLDEECSRVLAQPIEPDIATLFDRTKGTGKLAGRQRDAAFALIAWREDRARSRNRPRRWILADDQLIRIAASLPDTLDQLRTARELPPRLVQRNGEQLLEAIRNAEPIEDPAQLAPPDKDVVRTLQSEVRSHAERIGVAPELLATRRDIARTATGMAPEILHSGWRRSVLGEAFGRLS